MQKVSYVAAGDGEIVLVIDSQTFNVAPDHPNYGLVVEALREEDFDNLENLINMERAVKDFTNGAMTVEDGSFYYDDEMLPNTITNRILDMLEQGFNIDPMVAFLDNLFENPSRQSVTETYDFLEANKLPITSDGHFLAYKRVRADFTDCYTGTFDNSVGSICEMPRNKVQDDRDITCSTGLHFCGLSYLSSFRGENIVIVKINPRDVVSIPSDYNNAKGRTCRYEVVGVHSTASNLDSYRDESIPHVLNEAVQDDVDGSPARRVVQIDRYEDTEVATYDNVEDAAEALDCPVSYIRRVLIGDRIATGGYRWMFEDEWEEYLDEIEEFDPFMD